MTLEDNLRRALRRKPAPPDLAERVLGRIQQDDVVPATTRSASPRLPAVGWLATAAAIAVVATGSARYYTYQRTVAEAERVQNEVRLALQIAGEKVALVQRKLHERQR